MGVVFGNKVVALAEGLSASLLSVPPGSVYKVFLPLAAIDGNRRFIRGDHLKPECFSKPVTT